MPDATESRLPSTPMPAPALEAARVAARLDLCRSTLALRVVLFVQAVVALALALAVDGPRAFAHAAPAAALAALAGGGLWLAALCSARLALARWPAAARAGAAAAGGGLAALAGYALLLPLGQAAGGAWPLAAVAAAGTLLAALVWHWLTLRGQVARPAEASARLAELQSRIRPHFLFNALNTAIALVQIDPERAEAVLEDLAEIFRVALAEVGAEVSLQQEIELARRYLEIEQLRFGERLQVHWQLDAAAGGARVPPLVLQPLVENAVRHGIEPLAGGGRIEVRTAARRGMASITVRNSVGAAPPRPGAGIALANVRERLKLLHDIGASLDTGRDGDQFIARLVVPL